MHTTLEHDPGPGGIVLGTFDRVKGRRAIRAEWQDRTEVQPSLSGYPLTIWTDQKVLMLTLISTFCVFEYKESEASRSSPHVDFWPCLGSPHSYKKADIWHKQWDVSSLGRNFARARVLTSVSIMSKPSAPFKHGVHHGH